VTRELLAGIQIVEKGRPAAGLSAHIAVSKYCDALPLHRQEQIYARQRVTLSRSTMCDWVRVSTDLLESVAHEIHRQILKSEAIFADETMMKAQTQKKQGLHSGYIWGVLGPPGVYFHYSPSRASSVAVELLSGYEGFVHTDAYIG